MVEWDRRSATSTIGEEHMTALAEPPEAHMAKDTAKTRTIRMADDLVSMLKVIEAAAEISDERFGCTGDRFKPVEYLDMLNRKAISRDFEKARSIIARAGRKPAAD
jgi:hypothetical protein